MQHHETFTALERRRHLDVCAAAAAITAFNARLARSLTGEDEAGANADQGMIEVLATAFGPACAEIRILRGGAAVRSGALSAELLAAYRDKADGLVERAARAYVDAGQFGAELDRAAQRTGLLHPDLLRRLQGAG
ncbi:MAG: hypothetical protein WDN31_04710 [Hyphomicrobium sp.]